MIKLRAGTFISLSPIMMHFNVRGSQAESHWANDLVPYLAFDLAVLSSVFAGYALFKLVYKYKTPRRSNTTNRYKLRNKVNGLIGRP
jgi:hypothetical protein